MGFGAWEFEDSDLEFRAWEFEDSDLGFRAWGLGFGVSVFRSWGLFRPPKNKDQHKSSNRPWFNFPSSTLVLRVMDSTAWEFDSGVQDLSFLD